MPEEWTEEKPLRISRAFLVQGDPAALRAALAVRFMEPQFPREARVGSWFQMRALPEDVSDDCRWSLVEVDWLGAEFWEPVELFGTEFPWRELGDGDDEGICMDDVDIMEEQLGLI